VVDRWGERFEVVCKVNEDVIYTVCKGFDVHILLEELMMPLLFYILTRKSFYFSPSFAGTCIFQLRDDCYNSDVWPFLFHIVLYFSKT
jgi:hypothetical protein